MSMLHTKRDRYGFRLPISQIGFWPICIDKWHSITLYSLEPFPEIILHRVCINWTSRTRTKEKTTQTCKCNSLLRTVACYYWHSHLEEAATSMSSDWNLKQSRSLMRFAILPQQRASTTDDILAPLAWKRITGSSYTKNAKTSSWLNISRTLYFDE